MAGITYKDLEIQGGIGLKDLYDLEILTQPNHHATAYLKGMLEEATGTEEVEKLAENQMLIIKSKAAHNTGVLFKGYIRKASVKEQNQYYTVEIEAVSTTILLDEEAKQRAYQNKDLTYGQLVEKVLAPTTGMASYTAPEAQSRTMEAPLIAYKETDWEFLLRIASHLNLAVVPDETADKPVFTFGIQNIGSADARPFNENGGPSHTFFEKDFRTGILSGAYFKKSAAVEGVNASDFRYYEVTSQNNYSIGMKAAFDEKSLTICSKRAKLIKDEIIFTYRLGKEKAMGMPLHYNEKLQGRVLEGTVLDTKEELVKISLDIDDASSKGKEYEYEWIPETGNIMYCMPEKGTRVALYVGGADERIAWAIHNIRTNGETCKDTQDYEKRYFTTEPKKRYFLKKKETGFSTEDKDDGKIMFALQDENGICFKSDKNITVYADGDITINGKSMAGSAKSSVLVQQNGNGFTMNKRIDIRGSRTKMNLTVPLGVMKQWEDIQKQLQGMKQEELKEMKEEELVNLILQSEGTVSYKGCTAAQIAGVMSNMDSGSLSPKSKVRVNAQSFTKALGDGVESDQMVIKSPECVKEDGTIKWPKADGYVLKEDGETPDKSKVSLKPGDVLDRYGSEYGTYVSPVTKDGRYAYESRALPYIKNENAYHQYEVTRDFSELSEAVRNCEDEKLAEALKADAKRYNIDLEKLDIYGGKIAGHKAFDSEGGGIQYQLPLNIKYLKALGFVKER